MPSTSHAAFCPAEALEEVIASLERLARSASEAGDVQASDIVQNTAVLLGATLGARFHRVALAA